MNELETPQAPIIDATALERLMAKCTTKHQSVIVLIKALIGDGIVDRESLVSIAKSLGFNGRHVGMMLRHNTGSNPVSHHWDRDKDGRYLLID